MHGVLVFLRSLQRYLNLSLERFRTGLKCLELALHWPLTLLPSIGACSLALALALTLLQNAIRFLNFVRPFARLPSRLPPFCHVGAKPQMHYSSDSPLGLLAHHSSLLVP